MAKQMGKLSNTTSKAITKVKLTTNNKTINEIIKLKKPLTNKQT